MLCHGDFHPLNVLAVPGGLALHVIDWTNAGVGDRHGDISWTLLWFEIAAVAAPRPADRVLMRVLRRTLERAYLTGYRRVLPVDRERVRLWRPVSLLAIWSAAEASQRGFFGGEPRLPAGLTGWAARAAPPRRARYRLSSYTARACGRPGAAPDRRATDHATRSLAPG